MKNRIKYSLEVISLLMLVLVLTACGKSETIVPTDPITASATANINEAVKEIHIDAYNFGFTQDPITIKKGDKVRLRITSSEGTHGIRIPALKLSTEKISPGEEKTLEFVASEAGTLDYSCNIPCGSGNREMKGQLIIEE